MEAADNQQHTDKLRCINYVVYACLAYKNIFLNSENIIRSQWDPSISGPGRRNSALSKTWPYTTWHVQPLTMSLISASALLSLLSTLVKYQIICSSNFTGFSGISSSREFGQAVFGTSSCTSALQDNHRSFLKLCLSNAHPRESVTDSGSNHCTT